MSPTTASQHATLLVGGAPVPGSAVRALLALSAKPEGLAAIAALDAPSETPLEAVAEILRAAGHDARVTADPAASQAEVLLNAIGEGVCLGDGRGRILWANAFFRDLAEDVRAKISGAMRESAELFAARGDAARAAQAPAPTPGRACKFDIAAADGDAQFEVFVTPAPPRSELSGDLGEHSDDREAAADRAAVEGAHRVAGVVRDVTRPRRARLKLNAIDRAGYELVSLDGDAVAGKNTLERLALLEEKIVRITRDVLQYDHFGIFLIDQPAAGRPPRLELVVSEGLPAEVSDLNLTVDASGNGISGYVAATGQSYLCRNAESDERYIPGLPGCKSSLTVPLRLHDRVIGVMDVESKQTDAFDEDERQFLEIFARHVALALHMLDLLVVERCSVNASLSGRVGDEISEPLDDIIGELAILRDGCANPAETDSHLSRIGDDVQAIRRRLQNVAQGPNTLLGIDRSAFEHRKDPTIEGRRVLIADDQPKIRKIIGEVLAARGADVTVCSDGAEAVRNLERVEAGELQPYHLIISDIRMPERNGYEVFSASKRADATCPVILMTGFGYDPHHSIVRASQQGLHGVLYKPFELTRLLEEVHKALAPA